MNNAQHTPGPWWTTATGVRDRGGYICHTNPAQRYEGQDERFAQETAERAANKLLIAAAPDLLAIAKCTLALSMTPTSEGYAVLRRHGFQHNPDLREADFSQACAFVDSLCRAAVAKATGAAS